MIVVMSNEATEAQLEAVVKRVKEQDMDVNISRGTERTLSGLQGDAFELIQYGQYSDNENHEVTFGIFALLWDRSNAENASHVEVARQRNSEALNSSTKWRLSMWTKPAVTEMRFGFEVTMYVCNR